MAPMQIALCLARDNLNVIHQAHFYTASHLEEAFKLAGGVEVQKRKS